MGPNHQFPVDLATFTEETLNEKLHFLCSETKPWSFTNQMLQIFIFATIPLAYMVSTKIVYSQDMHVLLQDVPSRHLLNLLQFNPKNTRAMCKIKTSKRYQVVFLFDFEKIWCMFLFFPLLTLIKQMPTGYASFMSY